MALVLGGVQALVLGFECPSPDLCFDSLGLGPEGLSLSLEIIQVQGLLSLVKVNCH